MSGYVKPEFVVLLIMMVPGAVGGWLAANRARNVIGWCLLCALFPVFLLVIYFHKPLREVPGKFRQCPNCREFLKWRDTVCKYCNTEQPSGS
ncbi:hypothetical protein [Geobacter sp. AOG1]|uniref:hypothetical protein n=1 Tax=Geobacter sp. AOG1 TaxID=1566346 RepID=UPI001CC7176A|nr:hypothetical protein [Geobacter sp. AOG1]GFE59314.1 hypothetical protein AOG1_31940 [Geobacter sp. AOG1]